ncbi:Regulatory protein munI (plasmid) [Legionella adelaidensis]|uniref:Regulatory protein munI n=1 Tax=Legionella adelaidensis TaxID=45056 RepID=A0A0W0R239_9GAMM|nr:helix-turn-helix transcriptional regulator [Legionella adelaidensis]KTC65127.1 Regulatory protein munI (modular protein) [Legionella adelaidensis]VEH85472.1 Regulatory protein munI [Legionella adelaidensis]
MKEKHHNLVKIGSKIRELRLAKGYSQEGIADAAGMGRTYMGRVERGEQNISIQNLIQIAFALNVEVEALIPKITDLKDPNSH